MAQPRRFRNSQRRWSSGPLISGYRRTASVFTSFFGDEDLEDAFEYPSPDEKQTCVASILDAEPDPSLTISNRLWSGHQRRKRENKIKGKGFGYGLVHPDSEYTNTISARYYKDGSEILIAQENANPRKLSTREAARLQGFPEEFIINESSVQAYKQFGNSVSIPVIKACALSIRNCLEKGSTNDWTTGEY